MREYLSPLQPPAQAQPAKSEVKRYMIPSGVKIAPSHPCKKHGPGECQIFNDEVAAAKQMILKCREMSPRTYIFLWQAYYNIRADALPSNHKYLKKKNEVGNTLGFFDLDASGYEFPWKFMLFTQTVQALAQIAEEDGVPEEVFDWSTFPPKVKSHIAHKLLSAGAHNELREIMPSLQPTTRCTLYARYALKKTLFNVPSIAYRFCRSRVMLAKNGENWQLKISHKPLPERLKELPPPTND